MNYCVTLNVEIKGNQCLQLGDKHIIPWDYRDLIESSCGWTVVNEENIGLAKSFSTKLNKGIIELTQNREAYQRFEIRHGMGTINDVLKFYKELFKDCKDHPFAEIYGSVI